AASSIRELPALAKLALPLVQYQIDSSNRAEAATAAAFALKVDPAFAPALIVEGRLAEEKRDHGDARQKYEQALKAAPNHVIAQRQLGLILAEQASGDQHAAQLLNAARAALPKDAEIFKALGKIAYRRGDYREAARLLKDASFVLSQDADILYHL